MRLVNKNAVNSKFLKGHNIVLAGLVVKPFKPCFKSLFRLGKLLDGHAVSALTGKFLHTLHYGFNLGFKSSYLPFNRYGDFLKLRVSDNDSIVISRGNTSAEFLAVLGFKILFRSHQDICRGIELKVLTRPLFDKVIGYDEHTLIAESEPLALLCSGYHREGFACANNVGKESVSTVHNPCHRVFLMGAKGDFGVHSVELNV